MASNLFRTHTKTSFESEVSWKLSVFRRENSEFFGFVIFFNRAKMFPCEKLNQFLSVFVAPTRLKSLFLAADSILHLRSLSLWSNFSQILSRQRAWKSFAWLQTAFAWKVKLVSTTFDWVQDSLFFTSLICQKKQQTRILDHNSKEEISAKLVWRN